MTRKPTLAQMGSVHSLWIAWEPWHSTWHAAHPVGRFLYDACTGRIPPHHEAFRSHVEVLVAYADARMQELDLLASKEYMAERREPLAFELPAVGRTQEERDRAFDERQLLFKTKIAAQLWINLHRVWQDYTIEDFGELKAEG